MDRAFANHQQLTAPFFVEHQIKFNWSKCLAVAKWEVFSVLPYFSLWKLRQTTHCWDRDFGTVFQFWGASQFIVLCSRSFILWIQWQENVCHQDQEARHWKSGRQQRTVGWMTSMASHLESSSPKKASSHVELTITSVPSPLTAIGSAWHLCGVVKPYPVS